MDYPIKLIVGLGNPGPEYTNTRHNAGVWFIEELARIHQVSLKPEAKFHGYTARVQHNGSDFRLLVPTTFMNRSGQAVSSLANFYNIDAESILVAHDELDLPPGVAKLKRGGGHGGHNGLRDIISRMGNNKDFLRLRIGIGHPGDKNRVSGFVLGKAPKQEQEAIEDAIDEAARCFEIIAKDGLAKAMNRLHSFRSGQ
ncbi:aminoacyl-tRNA hydrolase [Echinimonas agarilytica]|uniref:Peptidyl-tRNA hydrolase n=1 Tax=Echinimonas agarilytica TaxID=1215918 RepID=A0AA41W5I1_9GAMM|nr:aminoacyl-tRNA hydrolase [Echinimonas agarilytica]MCM2679098.1 aminoacyl-tRNA hydrolase [Echinimonas agarilytica]